MNSSPFWVHDSITAEIVLSKFDGTTIPMNSISVSDSDFRMDSSDPFASLWHSILIISSSFALICTPPTSKHPATVDFEHTTISSIMFCVLFRCPSPKSTLLHGTFSIPQHNTSIPDIPSINTLSALYPSRNINKSTFQSPNTSVLSCPTIELSF
ncbi:uncharacterized protein MONOS_3 [Monocercomonoides exilis]|uniref:uncharacterized protein n=1 Tax=Monocercomonoides exilis TaxID=2049356 RepID=UPI00355948BE|nr:hypothetical protein MONOS_3 [Monocercomonoides exilis]|eukprot:MONOS_3.1-p1 / transcript=MONOS_3.1 / gene=MONOS_3 / organism=Monocercomonoides_exilis_PA203 / gene_product=unspecified product / transcript_product=unspecified product / location=Mono_scaffold00001:10697-11161(+) / protein_length=155 / sequence_SO=supercontig / SO=protein_coding / is_pseudo=false